MTNTITVAIPFSGESLGEFMMSVRSVFSQTLKWDELLLVSDDARPELVRAAQLISDPRVQVIHDGVRRGLPSRLNQIANLARGDVLVRMDADDIMFPDRLAHQVPVLVRDGHDVVGGRMVRIDESGRILGLHKEGPLPTRPAEFLRSGVLSHPTVVGWTDWFRRNPYAHWVRAEDKELWLRTGGQSSFKKIERPCCFYRVTRKFNRAKLVATASGDAAVTRTYARSLVGLNRRVILGAVPWLKQALWSSPLGPLAWQVQFSRYAEEPSPDDQYNWRASMQTVLSTQVPGWQASDQRSWVLIGSANGSSNLGDESMWLAAAQRVRELDPEALIVTDGGRNFVPFVDGAKVLPYITPALERGRKLRGLPSKLLSRVDSDRYAAKRARLLAVDPGRDERARMWAETISTSQGLVFTGAGAICDDYSRHGVHSWSLMADLAARAQVPMLMVGQGLGPLTGKVNRNHAAQLLRSAEQVSVRAHSSRDLAIELGVAPGRVVTTGDWAVGMQIDQDARARARETLRALLGSVDAPFWAVSFHRRSLLEPARARKLASLITELYWVAESQARRLVFIPNMTAGLYSDDRRTARMILSLCPAAVRNGIVLWEQPGDPMQVKAALGCAELVVSSRYHPLVFALDEGVHAVGVSFDDYYDAKLEGAATLYGLQGSTFRLGADIDVRALIRRVQGQAVCPNPETARAQILAPLDSFVSKYRAPGSFDDDEHSQGS